MNEMGMGRDKGNGHWSGTRNPVRIRWWVLKAASLLTGAWSCGVKSSYRGGSSPPGVGKFTIDCDWLWIMMIDLRMMVMERIGRWVACFRLAQVLMERIGRWVACFRLAQVLMERIGCWVARYRLAQNLIERIDCWVACFRLAQNRMKRDWDSDGDYVMIDWFDWIGARPDSRMVYSCANFGIFI